LAVSIRPGDGNHWVVERNADAAWKTLEHLMAEAEERLAAKDIVHVIFREPHNLRRLTTEQRSA
jgi:hypothetical protein